MRRGWAWLGSLWVVLAICAATLLGWAARPAAAPDLAMVNDLRAISATAWPDLQDANYPQHSPDFTVVDTSGTVVFNRGEPITDELDAARQRAHALDLGVNGHVVGRIYIVDAPPAALISQRAGIVSAGLVLLGVIGVAASAWYLWLWRRLVRPFNDLQDFAEAVASGDLDAPLRMDRANAFGAFTESFDLMRTELRRARASEEAAQTSKRDLIAQLSHDIRTPVASIAASGELLALNPDAEISARAGLILNKTQQLEALIADLFDANDDQLQALGVHPVEMPSERLARLLRQADDAGLIAAIHIPDALIEVDPARLRQVFDNVITNSAKYAGTPITVTGTTSDDLLTLTIADTGPGAPDAELATLVAKGVRGTNVGNKPGLGLGLFTSAHLMERMGGALECRNTADGFAVDVSIALAGSGLTKV